MMNKQPLATLALSASILIAAAIHAGPLNPPPGPVASTYKTLSEVQPRTAVNAANTPGDPDSLYRITQPGSYYLTGNITGVTGKHAIKIDADYVSLDLSGFTLQGVPGSFSGIFVVGARPGIAVRNGSVNAFGAKGVDAVLARASHFEDLSLSANGTYGLDMGAGSVAIHCLARAHASAGIRANDGSNVLSCTVTNNADGIICGGGTVRDCVARGNSIDGIRVNSASIVTGCSATANDGGIVLLSDCTAYGNATAFNGWGIYAVGPNNRVEANTISGNTIGIELIDTGNLVIRNSLGDNTTVLLAPIGNAVGPTVFPNTITNNTNPHANYAY